MTKPVYYPAGSSFPFSTAVRVGDLLLLSGQIPFDADGKPSHQPIAEQTHAVMRQISAALQELGSSMKAVVKATVWLDDLADFAAFNEAYRGYFEAGRYPARSLVQAQLAFDVGVEIEVQAYAPQDI